MSGSGWTGTPNTSDSMQASGPWPFSSHHCPGSSGEARFTSPCHFREHIRASWQLLPDLLSESGDRVHSLLHQTSPWNRGLQLSSLMASKLKAHRYITLSWKKCWRSSSLNVTPVSWHPARGTVNPGEGEGEGERRAADLCCEPLQLPPA